MVYTKIVKINHQSPNEEFIRQAADIIARGGLVIIPTETVYGIAADGSNKDTLERLYEVKKRPKEKYFSFHIDTKEKIEKFSVAIPLVAYKFIDKFWPGPLTLILESKNAQTVGIRMPDNEVALRVIALSGVDVVCPSANISGKPPPVNFRDAIEDLKDAVDFAIDSGETKLHVASTIVDVTVEPFKVLREGAIKKEALDKVAGKKIVLFICTGNSCRSVMAEGLLKKKLREQKKPYEIDVLSAGLITLGNMGATKETVEIMKRVGVDVSQHYSQRVTRDLLNKADIILVMEKIHEEKIRALAPRVKNRIFLLKEFAQLHDSSMEIPDPIGHSLEFYQGTFNVIKKAIDKVAELI